MDLDTFKKQFIREELGLGEDYGRIFTFIDFGNVNNWFESDTQDWENKPLKENQGIEIDVHKLKEFADIFSVRTRAYYGHDPHNAGSQKFTYVMRKAFGKREFVTKRLQRIKHYIGDGEKQESLFVRYDKECQQYIEIRKSNFDVEVAVDATKMLPHYDTCCLFSGDADFAYLNQHLRSKGKKVILIKAGYITEELRDSADLVLNAQRVKKYIAQKVEKTRT